MSAPIVKKGYFLYYKPILFEYSPLKVSKLEFIRLTFVSRLLPNLYYLDILHSNKKMSKVFFC